MLELIIKSLRDIFANKGRMILTLSGIAVGVAAVIVTTCIGDMGKAALTGEIDSLGMGGLSVSQRKDNAPLSINELKRIQGLSYVSNAMPVIFETTNVYMKDEQKDICLFGIDQTADKTISLSLQYGRFFNTGDIASGSRICMVDQKFARENYGTENIVGKTIIINSGNTTDRYTVVGIIKTGSGLLQNLMGGLIPSFVYIPYSTMQGNLSSNNFSQIIIKTKNDTDYDTAEKDIIRRIEQTNHINNGYIINNLARQKENLDNIFDIFSAVLAAVGSISLIVAGMNIMNVMLVSVTEQTREIGIKKAIGAGKKSIILEFLTKSAVISLTGCLLGIVTGAIIAFIGSLWLGLTIALKVDIIVLMLTFSLATGIIFGIYPAWKAASLKPVDALRFY